MFTEGTTFWVTSDIHLWAIISDPAMDPDNVVHVNFTSLDGSSFANDPYNDPACVIAPGEHPFIVNHSCVYYAGAQSSSIAALERLRSRRELRFGEKVCPALLQRMRQGAAISQHILPVYCDILVDQGLV